MSDHKETDSKNDLNADDVELWREMTRDVKKMEGRDYIEPKPSKKPQSNTSLDYKDSQISPSKPKAPVKKPQGVDVDRNTMKRLKRGEIAVEGRLDLHGFNQGEARESLVRFICAAHAAGKRCVLVVTGKGNTGRRSEDWLARKPGILKQRVPEWLREDQLGNIVLQAVAAHRKDGGDGALYVYLRRRRD